MMVLSVQANNYILRGTIENGLAMVKQLCKEKCTTELQAWNREPLAGSHLILGHDKRRVNTTMQ